MALDKLVDGAQLDSDLGDIADAIRAKGGTSAQLAFPAGFVSAVQEIETGTTPSGTKNISISANGTTTEDVAAYANAEITVNVSPGGETYENMRITLTNNRGGSTTFIYPQLNDALSALSASSSAISNNATATITIAKHGNKITFKTNVAIASMTYNGTAVEKTSTGSGSNRHHTVTIPENYDSDVAIIFT
jgi:hypothetical protein